MGKYAVIAGGVAGFASLALCANNLAERADSEQQTDQANAAVAQAYLDNQSEITRQVDDFIAADQAKIDRIKNQFGPACKLLIEKVALDTDEKRTEAGKCTVNPDVIKASRKDIASTKEHVIDLSPYVEGTDYSLPLLEQYAENAREVIEDAKSFSYKEDIGDKGPDQYGAISAQILGDDVSLSNVTGNKYDEMVAGGFLEFSLIAAIGGIFAGSIMDDKSKRTTASTTSPTPLSA